MSAMSPLLELAAVELFEQDRRDITLQGWISGHEFLGHLSKGVACDFSIEIKNDLALKQAYATDCNRMCMACFESINGIEFEFNRSNGVGWAVVRAYYASFFAAHAILRLFRRSCSSLGQSELRAIEEIFSLTHTSNISSKPGLFCVNVDDAYTIASFTRLDESHKDTWRQFHVLLKELLYKVDTLTASKVSKFEMIGVISKLCDGISRGSSLPGSWLSMFRNTVNYQHGHKSWWPHTPSEPVKNSIRRAQSLWKGIEFSPPLGSTAYETETFFETVRIVVWLLHTLLMDGRALLGKGVGSIFTHGTFKHLNLIKNV